MYLFLTWLESRSAQRKPSWSGPSDFWRISYSSNRTKVQPRRLLERLRDDDEQRLGIVGLHRLPHHVRADPKALRHRTLKDGGASYPQCYAY